QTYKITYIPEDSVYKKGEGISDSYTCKSFDEPFAKVNKGSFVKSDGTNKEVFFENGFALQNEVIELPELIPPKKYRVQKDKYIEQELKTINRYLGFQKENGFAKQNEK